MTWNTGRDLAAKPLAICGADFTWMQNLRDQSPCMVAGYVQGACSSSNATIPVLDPGEQYPLPNSQTANVCTCSWASYNLLNACAACQRGAIQTWSAYQHSCGASTTASAWSGAVSYFPPDIVLTDKTALPFWASINPANWPNGKFNVAQARLLRDEGHTDVGSTAPTCYPEYRWAENSIGQSPCSVAASIKGTCSDTNVYINLPPLQPGESYSPPNSSTNSADDCACSWVSYNLLSACMECQHVNSFPDWDTYKAGCGSFLSETEYFPSNRPMPAVPYWATTNPSTWPNGSFNAQIAQMIVSQDHPDFIQAPKVPASAPPIDSSPDLIVGALEIGVLLSLFLFGIVTRQTHLYYSRFPHDPKMLKTLVATIWLLELGHAISLSHGTYKMTVNLSLAPSSISLGLLFSGVIGSLVQAYFSHRVRVLSNNHYIAVFLWCISACRFVGWIIVGVIGSLTADVIGRVLEDVWMWILFILLVSSAAVDMLITVYLCYYFYRSRANMFKRTTKLVDRLIIWTIQNGLITSVAGVATAICFRLEYETSIWVAILAVLTRLFSNSFMASVNDRIELRALAGNTGLQSDISALQFSPPIERQKVDLYSQSSFSVIVLAPGQEHTVSSEESPSRTENSTTNDPSHVHEVQANPHYSWASA